MEHLQEILAWFRIIGIPEEEISEDKLKRQLSIISSWFAHNCIGYFLAVTGFGKTLVAIIAIHRLNLKYDNANTIVIVPSIKLRNDWEQHIRTFGLRNVEVHVINSYTSLYLISRIKQKCSLLIIDELHNAISENAFQFNKTIEGTQCDMFLGMTATLDDKERELLHNMNISFIDEVSMSEAQRFQYISNYIVYNYGIRLNEEEQLAYDKLNDIHNSNWSKFLYFPEGEKNFELARACAVGNSTIAKVGVDYKSGLEWRNWYSEEMNWDGDKEHPWSPTNIAKYANQWSWAMKERKSFLNKHNGKIRVAHQIINHLDTPTITFAENTAFADELAAVVGRTALAYHSNLVGRVESVSKTVTRKTLVAAKRLQRENGGSFQWNEEEKGYIIKYNETKSISPKRLRQIAISKFESGEIKVLSTAKALDEGFNVKGIGCAIICSGSSKKRQYIQRMGRTLRFIPGKTAKIVNIYFKDTQDEVWLKRRQKGDPGVKWIDKITDIV